MLSVFPLGKVEGRWVARIDFQRRFSSTQHSLMHMLYPHHYASSPHNFQCCYSLTDSLFCNQSTNAWEQGSKRGQINSVEEMRAYVAPREMYII